MLCWLECARLFSAVSVPGLWLHLLARAGTGMQPSLGLFRWKESPWFPKLASVRLTREIIKIQWPGLRAKPPEWETLWEALANHSWAHTSMWENCHPEFRDLKVRGDPAMSHGSPNRGSDKAHWRHTRLPLPVCPVALGGDGQSFIPSELIKNV